MMGKRSALCIVGYGTMFFYMLIFGAHPSSCFAIGLCWLGHFYLSIGKDLEG